MWIERLQIRKWRNFSNIDVGFEENAPLICLVGENGTGKSSILELITFAASQWGLAEGPALKRPFHMQTFVDHELALTLRLSEEEQQRIQLPPGYPDAWDGTLVFAARSAQHGEQQLVLGSAQHFDEGMHLSGTYAGGLGDHPVAVAVATQVRDQLMRQDALLFLYVDAERFFPPHNVQDADVLAAAREQLHLPNVLRQQAAQLTQNAYHLWMRAMLGRQQRLSTEYLHQAQRAKAAGDPIPDPPDPLASYRNSLASVLPHLRFERLDDETRRLLFSIATEELAYEQLSGGEREIAFLVGQLDRFQIGNGLFLLDEPELHLNPSLVRDWIEFLRTTVRGSQAWIATHSLEAVEVAGSGATTVLLRDSAGVVSQAARLSEQPVIQALASSVGSPAFSVSSSRFVLIEGEAIRGERERFRNALGTDTTVRFLEAGGCGEVIRRFQALRQLAEEEPQLNAGAIVDHDFRDAAQVEALQAQGVHVLAVHEIENLFLHPDTLGQLCSQAGLGPESVLRVMQQASDEVAGRWLLQYAAVIGAWDEVPGSAVALSRRLAWVDVESDPASALGELADLLTTNEPDRIRRRASLVRCANEYRELREDLDRLWQRCLGKEVLDRVSRALQLESRDALEVRAVQLWRAGTPRPSQVDEVRDYIEALGS